MQLLGAMGGAATRMQPERNVTEEPQWHAGAAGRLAETAHLALAGGGRAGSDPAGARE